MGTIKQYFVTIKIEFNTDITTSVMLVFRVQNNILKKWEAMIANQICQTSIQVGWDILHKLLEHAI